MSMNQKGFTLIELLVVTAIGALVAAGLSMGIVQMIQNSERSEDHQVALRQSQNVGYWISRDIMRSKTINSGDMAETGDIEILTIFWTEFESGDVHEVRYTLEDAGEGLKHLYRKHKVVDLYGMEKSNNTTSLGDNLYSASFSEGSGIWVLDVKSSEGSESFSLEYNAEQKVLKYPYP